MNKKRQYNHTFFQGLSLALVVISLLLVIYLAFGNALDFLKGMLGR